jgi:hypothetical protein
MRVIIAGGRDFNDYKKLKFNCDYIISERSVFDRKKGEEIEIVCGCAKGADALGEKYAKENGLKIKYFPADWDKYGKSAGFKRNEQMALYAKEENGVLIAFWDRKSRGTKLMIDLASKHELRSYTIKY